LSASAREDKLWTPPDETHSDDALLLSQWASGEYWERQKVATRHRPPRPEGVEKKIRTLVDTDYGANLLAWETVRDAILDLPDPERHPNKVQTHRFQPGARLCRHTGGPPHRPTDGKSPYPTSISLCMEKQLLPQKYFYIILCFEISYQMYP
jgi:DNA (cytosine-5)-methyltransferase 1